MTYLRLPSGIPAEQGVHWQKLRPGSGCLSVKIVMDGPTRVLQVTDFRNKPPAWSEDQAASTSSARAKEFKVEMRLKSGLGVSIINHSPPEELAYCRLYNIFLEVLTGDGLFSIDSTVQSIQIDNSLRDPLCPVNLYVTPCVSRDESRHLPALQLTLHRQSSTRLNADIFKHMIITLKNLTINIEENQLYKLLALAGFNQSDLEVERADENDYEAQRSLNAATSIDAKRFYFFILKLELGKVMHAYVTRLLFPGLGLPGAQ